MKSPKSNPDSYRDVNPKSKNYLSVHLFYEDLDFLLVNGVFPFIELAQRERFFEQYFFIRYSEGGLHVRLRMLTDNKEDLKSLLEAYFNNFFKKNPSERAEEIEGSFPNNSIQYIAYQQELVRYGGKENIQYVEEQFYLSSVVCKKLIQSEVTADNNKMSIGLQLQIMLLHTIGFSKKEAFQFFNYYFKRWQQVLGLSPERFKLFKELSFQSVQPEFKMQILNLWNELDENPVFDGNTLSSWYRVNQSIFNKMNISDFERIPIIDSFIHMTNNRLGITNHDEVFMAHILWKCFEE